MRLPSAARGRTFKLRLFDIADGAPTNVTVVAPAESATIFTACAFTRDGIALPGSVTINGCTINNLTNADWNGHELEISVPIPAGYACDDPSSTGCWLSLGIETTGMPNDTFTATANVVP